jgi:hypothetical protein
MRGGVLKVRNETSNAEVARGGVGRWGLHVGGGVVGVEF